MEPLVSKGCALCQASYSACLLEVRQRRSCVRVRVCVCVRMCVCVCVCVCVRASPNECMQAPVG